MLYFLLLSREIYHCLPEMHHIQTRIRVVHVVEFGGGPKFEAYVRRLNPSATGGDSIE